MRIIPCPEVILMDVENTFLFKTRSSTHRNLRKKNACSVYGCSNMGAGNWELLLPPASLSGLLGF
jgi:hypothetical protein